MRESFVAYLAAMRVAISEKVDADTISPTNVGEDGFADLVEILDDEIYDPSLFFGVTAPTAAQGNDKDFYVQFGTNEVFSFKKISGAWVSTGGADFGITFPDGNFTVRTSLASGTTTATAGFWYLNNNQYSKTTQSQFTASTADNTLETQDLIYGTTSNTILYINGAPGLGQPALPANSVLIDVVVVPSVASGADPYLVYGQTQEDLPISDTINAREFGMVSDGVTDNTSIWNQLMTLNPGMLNVFVPSGVYNGTFSINRDNVVVTGEAMPSVSSDKTRLENGAILAGTVLVNGSNCVVENIGADMGSFVVSTLKSNAQNDAFTAKDPTFTNTRKNNRFENIVGLTADRDAPYHSVLIEKQSDGVVRNVYGVLGYFGVVFKVKNFIIDGAHGIDNNSVGVYFKGNSYAEFGQVIARNISSVSQYADYPSVGGIALFNETGTSMTDIQISDYSVTGGNNAFNISAATGKSIERLNITNGLIKNPNGTGLDTQGNIYNLLIDQLQVYNPDTNIALETRSGTLNSIINNVSAYIPDVTGNPAFVLNGQVIINNIRATQYNNNGLKGDILVRGSIQYGEIWGNFEFDGGTVKSEAWEYIKNTAQSISGTFSFTSDINTKRVRSNAITDISDGGYNSANFFAQVSQSDYDAGKYPSIGFEGQNRFGQQLYAPGYGNLKLRTLTGLDYDVIFGTKTNISQIRSKVPGSLGSGLAENGAFLAQITSSDFSAGYRPVYGFLVEGVFSTGIYANDVSDFRFRTNSGDEGIFYTNVNNGFVTDGDITGPIVAGSYNSGNNFTDTITPTGGAVFLQGQKYKDGNFFYFAIDDNEVTRIPLSGQPLDITTKTSNYTLTSEDRTVLIDATGGNITISVPAASTVLGHEWILKRIDASGNTVTVDPNGSETIDGASTASISSQWSVLRFVSNGTNLFKTM